MNDKVPESWRHLGTRLRPKVRKDKCLCIMFKGGYLTQMETQSKLKRSTVKNNLYIEIISTPGPSFKYTSVVIARTSKPTLDPELAQLKIRSTSMRLNLSGVYKPQAVPSAFSLTSGPSSSLSSCAFLLESLVVCFHTSCTNLFYPTGSREYQKSRERHVSKISYR